MSQLGVLALLLLAGICCDAARNGALSRSTLRGDHGNLKTRAESEDDDQTSLPLFWAPSPGGDDPFGPKNFCYDPNYRRMTMKLIKEMPFIGLFNNLQNQTRFEASGIAIAKGYGWVVYDSLRAIGRVDLRFNFRGVENLLIPEDQNERESQFEGLSYCESTDTFFVVRETYLDPETGKLVSKTEELKFAPDNSKYSVVGSCILDYTFEDTNKGIESMYYFEKGGERYLMALCESNYCRTIVPTPEQPDPPGLDRGHGRVILAKMTTAPDGDCEWAVEKVIKVPRRAKFLDFAGMAFHGYMGRRVAVISQEDAALWIGEFDWDEMEFVGKGKVFHFPRNEHCEKIYCNVEGVQFIDSHRVVLTSDKAKSIQPHACMHKDQSIQIMALPR